MYIYIYHVIDFSLVLYIIVTSRRYGFPWPHLVPRLYCALLSASLPGYILYQYRAVEDRYIAGRPTISRPCEVVYRSTSLISLSLLLQQCSIWSVRLTWIVFQMGGRWPVTYIYIYIYIYVCVCVCVCVYFGSISSLIHISLNNIHIFCLHIF